MRRRRAQIRMRISATTMTTARMIHSQIPEFDGVLAGAGLDWVTVKDAVAFAKWAVESLTSTSIVKVPVTDGVHDRVDASAELHPSGRPV